MQKMIYAMNGESALTDWMCQKRFAKFCAGDFSPDDVPQLGRPVQVDSDQIETLIEKHEKQLTYSKYPDQ